MTIEKGTAWGEASGPAPQASVSSDAAVAAEVSGHRGVAVSASAGDLVQTLGLGAGPRADALWFPIDLGFVSLDGGDERPFVAHVVARGPLWLGEGAAVMNAAWLGDLYLGPRSHPNDGILDVTVGALPFRQLLAARSRARTGVHLPHPALAVKRVDRWVHEFARPRNVWVDGVRIGRARHLSCRVEPDWFQLVG